MNEIKRRMFAAECKGCERVWVLGVAPWGPDVYKMLRNIESHAKRSHHHVVASLEFNTPPYRKEA